MTTEARLGLVDQIRKGGAPPEAQLQMLRAALTQYT